MKAVLVAAFLLIFTSVYCVPLYPYGEGLDSALVCDTPDCEYDLPLATPASFFGFDMTAITISKFGFAQFKNVDTTESVDLDVFYDQSIDITKGAVYYRFGDATDATIDSWVTEHYGLKFHTTKQFVATWEDIHEVGEPVNTAGNKFQIVYSQSDVPELSVFCYNYQQNDINWGETPNVQIDYIVISDPFNVYSGDPKTVDSAVGSFGTTGQYCYVVDILVMDPCFDATTFSCKMAILPISNPINLADITTGYSSNCNAEDLAVTFSPSSLTCGDVNKFTSIHVTFGQNLNCDSVVLPTASISYQNCPDSFVVDSSVPTTVVWKSPKLVSDCPAKSSNLIGPGSEFPLGLTTVNYKATSVTGQTASCSFSVAVYHTEVCPVVDCPKCPDCNPCPPPDCPVPDPCLPCKECPQCEVCKECPECPVPECNCKECEECEECQECPGGQAVCSLGSVPGQCCNECEPGFYSDDAVSCKPCPTHSHSGYGFPKCVRCAGKSKWSYKKETCVNSHDDDDDQHAVPVIPVPDPIPNPDPIPDPLPNPDPIPEPLPKPAPVQEPLPAPEPIPNPDPNLFPNNPELFPSPF